METERNTASGILKTCTDQRIRRLVSPPMYVCRVGFPTSLGLSSTKSDERAEARRGIRENRNSFLKKKRRTSIEAEKKELLKTLFCFKAIHSFFLIGHPAS